VGFSFWVWGYFGDISHALRKEREAFVLKILALYLVLVLAYKISKTKWKYGIWYL
jgi:hypothetical protein